MPRNPKPPNAPEGTVWFGGEVECIDVCLRVLGNDLNPQEVTNLFGCEPTRAGRKGEPVTRSNGQVIRHRPTGVWILDLTPMPDSTVAEAIIALLGKLPQDPALWRSLIFHFQVDLLCDVTLRGVNQGFVLSSDVVKSVAALGVSLGVDIFHEPDAKQAAILTERLRTKDEDCR